MLLFWIYISIALVSWVVAGAIAGHHFTKDFTIGIEDWLMASMLGLVIGMLWPGTIIFLMIVGLSKYIAGFMSGSRQLPSLQDRKLRKREMSLESRVARQRHIKELERELGIE